MRRIARRDFLNGAAIGAGAILADGWLRGPGIAAGLPHGFPQDVAGYDPPRLTGLRGSHAGSFEIAHAARDGTFDERAAAERTEPYDLVVVGGGISGLAAAHFYRARHPGARILILENHDDFGGHAKRNEFRPRGRLLLTNGGTYAVESPLPYSSVARGLLTELGIDPPALAARDDRPATYAGLGAAVFFDRETFGTDRLVTGLPRTIDDPPAVAPGSAAWAAFLRRTPLSPRARRDILRIETGHADPYAGASSAEKKDRLSRISYRSYLIDVLHAHPDVVAYYQTGTHDLFGVGIDGVSALDCWGLGFPGFTGLRLEPGPHPRMGFTAKGAATPGQPAYTFHFPDGNATIARLLVRGLFPGTFEGSNAADIVTARADYRALDRPGAHTRMRLGSTAVRVRHDGDPDAARHVEVTYVRGGRLFVTTAGAVVLACWNAYVPYLMPELPAAQREALRYGAKVPLVYTAVAVRNWRAFHRLGVRSITTPGMYHSSIRLDDAVDVGAYVAPRTPDEPIVVRMLRTPCRPGLSERDQHRAGRADLLATPYAVFERHIVDQLGRVLGPGGFEAARDIAAITVNRWPHGYAYEYNPLWDPERFFTGGRTPCELARRPFGRVAIANSDAAAAAYTDRAIDQAHRAVSELPAPSRLLTSTQR